jgi:hypothetical protein
MINNYNQNSTDLAFIQFCPFFIPRYFDFILATPYPKVG